MQLSAVALLIAMSLAMPDALGAGRGEGGDAAGQRPLGVALQSFSPAASNDGADLDRIRRLISPHIEGDVLVIEGKIDSHIYDYLQYEAAKIVPVKLIELNSLGGSNEWALEIARKIKELGKKTVLSSGHYCASACAYLFAAGRERVAAEDTWIGIHGARLGVGYLTSFQGLCFVDLDTGSAFEPRKKGCQDFLAHWREVAVASTNEAFDAMESNGVSPDLRRVYFQMPDDPDWPDQLNVVRKPDWRLTASDALKYRLVTAVLPRTAY
jgi:membrane-bound ClpP family serine protease